MQSSLDPEIFDQWWDQALAISVSRTKTFILDAKMGLDPEFDAADDLVYDTDDSDATPVFRKSPHSHLQYHKFVKFADALRDFPDPLVVASQVPSKYKNIQCPCQACPATAKNRFKSYVGALSLPVTMNTMFLTFLLELFSLASPRLTDDHSYYYNLHFFIYLFIYFTVHYLSKVLFEPSPMILSAA
jgi:hypothetical protein